MMKSKRAWWAFALMICLCAIPCFYASFCIGKLVLTGFFTTQTDILNNAIGSIVLILCGMMPFFIMLPSYVTAFDEESIRQSTPLFNKRIEWDQVEKVEITDHLALVFHSHKQKIRVSAFCFNEPQRFLAEVLNFPSLEKAKVTMEKSEWNKIIDLREKIG